MALLAVEGGENDFDDSVQDLKELWFALPVAVYAHTASFLLSPGTYFMRRVETECRKLAKQLLRSGQMEANKLVTKRTALCWSVKFLWLFSLLLLEFAICYYMPLFYIFLIICS